MKSNYQLLEHSSGLVKMWTNGVHVEDAAKNQLRQIASLPIVHGHIAVMPDVHLGKGATVGSVIPTRGAIIPATVGVDIGCGMIAVQTSMSASDLPDTMSRIRDEIERAIPVGQASHTNDKGMHITGWTDLDQRFETIMKKYPKIRGKLHPAFQLGSLGGGNHFIEICLDESDRVWVMLHSGSRGIGNRIGTYFIERAKEEMQRLGIKLQSKDLSYLLEDTQLFDDYVESLLWAQDYARRNRDVMLDLTLKALRAVPRMPRFKLTNLAVNCHHNYVAKEEHFGVELWITRKGAVRAGTTDLGIIPGSMGTKSYIVRGKGNTESFCSCSHGAGRMMSRSAAKSTFTLKDHRDATMGIECRKDEGVIDETPAAYKNIDAVMAAQTDLVEVLHTLRQIVCVKG